MGLRYFNTLDVTGYSKNNLQSGFILPPGARIAIQCQATDIGIKFSDNPNANANPNDPDTLLVKAGDYFETTVDGAFPVLAVGSTVEPTFAVRIFLV